MRIVRLDIGGVHFEWDSEKAASNERKHGVSFLEKATAFADDNSITIPDPLHSNEEDRFILIGISATSKLLTVVHVSRGETYRIIRARKSTPKERRTYEQ